MDTPNSNENWKTAATALADQSQKLEIANYYTHGNFENAKKMVAGTYKDMCALKIKFTTSSVFGAVLIFVNTVYSTVHDYFGIVSNNFNVDDISNSQTWRKFEEEIAGIRNENDHDDVLGQQIKDKIFAGMRPDFVGDLKKNLDQGDDVGLNHQFQKLFQERVGFSQLKIHVDFDIITSLDMELYSVSSRKVDPAELKGKKDEKSKKSAETEEDNPLDGKIVKLVLNGSVVLSPIKGKDISSCTIRDRIMIRITDTHDKAVSVGRAFKAINEETGAIQPIPGRIVSIKHMPHGGYKIFAVIAKGIYVKVEEEEETIKVKLDPTVEVEMEKQAEAIKSKSKISGPLIAVAIIALFGIIGIIFALFV